MTEPTKPGEPTGTPTPGQALQPGQQAPANQPGTPAPVAGTPAPGTVQTPPAGVTPSGTPGTPAPGTPAAGTPAPGTPAPGTPSAAVPLDRRPAGTPPPGAPTGDQTVPLKALQEEREKRQGLQVEVDRLTQVVQGIQNNGGTTYGAPQGAPQVAQQPNPDPRAHIDKLWETDPKQAVQAEISNSLTYYDSVNANIESQANFLGQKYPDFGNYRTTAMNYIRTLPYDQRAQEGIVELAYMVARGQNVDSILQTKEQELMEKFKTGQLAGALNQPAGASGQPFTPAAGTELTSDQKVAAQAMGMSEEDYIANIDSKVVSV